MTLGSLRSSSTGCGSTLQAHDSSALVASQTLYKCGRDPACNHPFGAPEFVHSQPSPNPQRPFRFSWASLYREPRRGPCVCFCNGRSRYGDAPCISPPLHAPTRFVLCWTQRFTGFPLALTTLRASLQLFFPRDLWTPCLLRLHPIFMGSTTLRPMRRPLFDFNRPFLPNTLCKRLWIFGSLGPRLAPHSTGCGNLRNCFLTTPIGPLSSCAERWRLARPGAPFQLLASQRTQGPKLPWAPLRSRTMYLFLWKVEDGSDQQPGDRRFR